MNGTAILLAAALAPGGLQVTQFTLQEQPASIIRLFMERPHSAVSAAGQVLQFHGAAHSQGCDDGRQWVFFFEKTGRLVSVTRNLESPAALAAMLPKNLKVKVRLFQTGDGYPILRAALPDGRELIATGARSVGEPVSQIQLMHSVDVPRFYPGLRPAP